MNVKTCVQSLRIVTEGERGQMMREIKDNLNPNT